MKILIDASPLIAIVDKAQKDNHTKCVDYARTVKGSLITTLPCFSEALHIVDRMYAGKVKPLFGNTLQKVRLPFISQTLMNCNANIS